MLCFPFLFQVTDKRKTSGSIVFTRCCVFGLIQSPRWRYGGI